MELVLDTNVVFSALITDGKTRELVLSDATELSVPEFFYSELDAHRDEVAEKTGLAERDLSVLLNLLFEDVHVVPREEFEHALSEARRLIERVDPDDVPFLALAIHLDADVWTDDEHVQEQDAVAVWRTHELVERIEGSA